MYLTPLYLEIILIYFGYFLKPIPFSTILSFINPYKCTTFGLHVDDSKMKKIKQYFKENFTNFTYFYSILRSKLLVVIILSIFVGFLDSVGLTMFLPLLQLADGSSSTVDLGNLSFITDALAFLGIQLTITKALTFLVVVFLIKGIVVYISNLYRIKSVQFLTKNVRMEIVNKLPFFKYSCFVQTDIGKMQNVFIGEISRLASTFNFYIAMSQGLVLILIYMIFSFKVNWQFALFVCIGGLFSNFIFFNINKITKKKSFLISKVNNDYAGILIQYITGFKYLKASGNIFKFKDKVEKSIIQTQRQSFNIDVLTSFVSSFREPILIFVVVIVIIIQLNFFNATISSMLISLLFFYRSLTSLVIVQTNYNLTLVNQGAIDNIKDFIRELNSNQEPTGTINFNGFKSEIDINNLNFYFGDKKILSNISLNIKKNQSIAIVGESGSGKSTLINILSGLIYNKDNSIKIDNICLNHINRRDYQKKIGYISQEPTIFNDTLFNNVTFWSEKNSDNYSRFLKAIELSSLTYFLNSLPNKEDENLGYNGMNLSGGQRQRISIARELYNEVDILFLDEATSALDSETESAIHSSLKFLKGKITILTVAHRLSTVKDADVIYLLQDGKILISGSFDYLLNNSEKFKRMVQLQEV